MQERLLTYLTLCEGEINLYCFTPLKFRVYICYFNIPQTTLTYIGRVLTLQELWRMVTNTALNNIFDSVNQIIHVPYLKPPSGFLL